MHGLEVRRRSRMPVDESLKSVAGVDEACWRDEQVNLAAAIQVVLLRLERLENL